MSAPRAQPHGADDRVLLSQADLEDTCVRLGAAISRRYPHGALLVGVLHGCLPFLADLARAVGGPCEIDFMSLTPYTPCAEPEPRSERFPAMSAPFHHRGVAPWGVRRARILEDLSQPIAGRDVIVVTEIVDTGLTCGFLLSELARRDPRSLEVCTLLDRPSRRIVPIALDEELVGATVGEEILVGYGLCISGYYRNLSFVARVDKEQVAHSPHAHVKDFYGR